MRSISIASHYILTVIILGLLPLVLWIQLPSLNWITRITPPSSYNQDTGQNNQFTLRGQVAGTNYPSLFLDIYQKNSYQVFDFNFQHYRFVKTLSLDSAGNFLASGLDGGDYLIKPKSQPTNHVFFSRNYLVRLADHNPKPISIQPPTSSLLQFAIDKLSNSPYYGL